MIILWDLNVNHKTRVLNDFSVLGNCYGALFQGLDPGEEDDEDEEEDDDNFFY